MRGRGARRAALPGRRRRGADRAGRRRAARGTCSATGRRAPSTARAPTARGRASRRRPSPPRRFGLPLRAVVGASYDQGNTQFEGSSEFGAITADRTVAALRLHPRPAGGRRRAGAPAFDQQLRRPLRQRDAGRHAAALGDGRRAVELRRDRAARPHRHRAERPARLLALQPRRRRDLALRWTTPRPMPAIPRRTAPLRRPSSPAPIRCCPARSAPSSSPTRP